MGLHFSTTLACTIGLVFGDDATVTDGFAHPDVSALDFAETFQNGDVLSSGQWVRSQKTRYSHQVTAQEADKELGDGFSSDLGIVLKEPMSHYGFGKNLLFPVSLNNEFVLQYETKFDNGLTCGGAYLKLLRDNADLSILDDHSPYSIMFGPDKCGQTNKLHFILQYHNPRTLQWEEKHMKSNTVAKTDKKTHLYTLHLKPDGQYAVYIDKERAVKGTLLENFEPAFNPPAMIDDPADFKPDNWVNDEKMVDVTAVKPDDWDEDAPAEIEDFAAVKPSGWLDNEPELVKDPIAKKPIDWDDVEDGSWEAAIIQNPKCDKAPGCGKWSRPTIKNPDYKGKWSAPLVTNPAYVGEWKPQLVQNPNYYEDKNPNSNLAPVTGVAIEVWTTVKGIHFDNIIIGHDLNDAFKFADATWSLKHEFETSGEKAAELKERHAERERKRKEGGVLNLIEVTTADGLDWMGKNPVVCMVTAIVLFVSLMMFCTGKGSKDDDLEALQQQLEKKQQEEEENKADSSNAEVKAETNEVKSAEPTPVKSAEPTPVKSTESTPVKSAEPTPVKSTESTPVKSAEPTPVKSTESTPVKSAEPTPVKPAEPTPVKSAEPTPVKSAELPPSASMNMDTSSDARTPQSSSGGKKKKGKKV